jgi:hypothetical protein
MVVDGGVKVNDLAKDAGANRPMQVFQAPSGSTSASKGCHKENNQVPHERAGM